MYSELPTDLVFDDDPLDGVLYGAEVAGPSPADVLNACCAGDGLPAEALKAVVAILLRSPEKGRALTPEMLTRVLDHQAQAIVAADADNPREVLRLARLYHAAQCPEQAEAAYRRALAPRVGPAVLTQDERWEAVNHLAELLDQSGRTAEAKEALALGAAEGILADAQTESLVQVRSLALDLFLAGRQEAADRLYRGLLERGFQEPGTRVHLARVLLMSDRVAEVRASIAAAWRCLRRSDQGTDDIPPYVRPRILFLRILCAMRAGRPHAALVAHLKRALEANPKQEPWSIAPVIDHIRPGLSAADGEFLTALAEAINDADQLEQLDAFPLWAAAGRGQGGRPALPRANPQARS